MYSLQYGALEMPEKKEVWMGFQIESQGYQSEWCYMLIHVRGDAKTASFSNEKCVGSNFSVSWGHSREKDAGIMTLVR